MHNHFNDENADCLKNSKYLAGLENLEKKSLNSDSSSSVCHSYAYPKNKRLNQKDRFLALLKTKPVCKTDLFYAHAISNDLGYARLGMIIGKRFCKKAHDRNKIKRYMREYFRLKLSNEVIQKQNNMGAGVGTPLLGLDILLRLKANVVKPNFTTYAEYKKQLDYIFVTLLKFRYFNP